MLNKVELIGHLGKDIETFSFDDGNRIGKTTLATTEKWTKQNGEKHEKTEWHNIIFKGKTVDVAETYLKKGSKVFIEGKIAYRSWENEGVKHFATDIHCFKMIMLDNKQQ